MSAPSRTIRELTAQRTADLRRAPSLCQKLFDSREQLRVGGQFGGSWSLPAYSGGAVSHMRAGCGVAKSDVPAHAKARDPEREVRGELRQSLLRVLAAGRGIRHEAHTMPEWST